MGIGRAVASYLVYFIDPSGRIRLGEGLECPDDADAVARFRHLDRLGQAAELWQAGRLVARIASDGEFLQGSGA